MKGEDEDMFAFEEMFEEENKKIRAEGIKQGKKEGIEQGKKEGKQEERMEVIRKMKKNDLPTELIEKITGLTKGEIEKIKV